MSLQGKWQIVAMPDYVADYPDMMGPAYILFEETGSGAFAFGCVTGQISGTSDIRTTRFSWDGSDEMDEVWGDRWAQIEPDGSLHGEICFHNGDDAAFIAQRDTSSTAC